MRRVDWLEKTLMLGGIGGRGRTDDRGWDGWMASPTQWAWVWVHYATHCSLPASFVHRILQARILERVPFHPTGDLPDPRIKSMSPVSAGGFFTSEPPGHHSGPLNYLHFFKLSSCYSDQIISIILSSRPLMHSVSPNSLLIPSSVFFISAFLLFSYDLFLFFTLFFVEILIVFTYSFLISIIILMSIALNSISKLLTFVK